MILPGSYGTLVNLLSRDFVFGLEVGMDVCFVLMENPFLFIRRKCICLEGFNSFITR